MFRPILVPSFPRVSNRFPNSGRSNRCAKSGTFSGSKVKVRLRIRFRVRVRVRVGVRVRVRIEFKVILRVRRGK
eukprot:392929-Amorphochlora_amoeboformis.AAC.1